jgi:periplasmic protein TonB
MGPSKFDGGQPDSGDVIMLAIRAPFSAVAGAVCAVALFLGLAKLVNVPFPAGGRTVTEVVSLKRVRPDTPEQTIRNPRPDRVPPTLEPGPPDLTVDRGGVTLERVVYTRPTVDTRPRGHGILRGIDGDATPIVQTKPEYPPRELTRGTEGWVRVQFSVTAIGTVRDAVVVESEPDAVFDQAALKAIARWRYNPRVENGEAVERVGVQAIIRFTLEN